MKTLLSFILLANAASYAAAEPLTKVEAYAAQYKACTDAKADQLSELNKWILTVPHFDSQESLGGPTFVPSDYDNLQAYHRTKEDIQNNYGKCVEVISKGTK